MREFGLPALSDRVVSGGLADMAFENAESDPSAVLFARRDPRTGTGEARGKRAGVWSDVTTTEFREQVLGLAKGLVAKGIQPGDRVGIMSRTRYEWAVFDCAAWSVGACPVPIYPTSSASQAEWILADSGAQACLAETVEHVDLLSTVRKKLPESPELWCLDTGAIDDLCEAGKDVADEVVDARRKAVEPDDPATIVYTSGTTGRSKGCVLTHRNFLAEVDNAIELLHPVFNAVSKDPPSTLIFIPLAHVLGRMLQVGCVRAMVKSGHHPTIVQSELQDAFRTFRPTFLLGVPYVFEKIYNTARYTAEKMHRASSFDRSAKIAIRWAEAMERQYAGRTPAVAPTSRPRLRGRPGLSLARGLYDLLVYRRIRKELGGRLHYAICGGSPLGRRLALFFAGAQILVYEGYGLTETTAASTVNPPLAPRFGSVGRPLPGTSIRIAEDGEILVKGGQVFPRYWNDDEATKHAFVDGWLATGDIGELDADGYLTVTGRKKDIIVTSGGKNVAPAPLEDLLKAHPLVEQCLVLGDGRPFVTALITLDPDATTDWAKLHLHKDVAHNGLDGLDGFGELGDLAENMDLVAEVQRAVDAANATVSRAESIRAFRVLAEGFTEENGLLTPSMKVRRAAVKQTYEKEIEALYRGSGNIRPRSGR